MIKSHVQCWLVGDEPKLLITYPEGTMGYELICCVKCGVIYSVNVARKIYTEPDVDVKLRDRKCIGCGCLLRGNWVQYPDQYVGDSGKLERFERPNIIPDDADAIIREFPEIYEPPAVQ